MVARKVKTAPFELRLADVIMFLSPMGPISRLKRIYYKRKITKTGRKSLKNAFNLLITY
jgi:hypothetical protein